MHLIGYYQDVFDIASLGQSVLRVKRHTVRTRQNIKWTNLLLTIENKTRHHSSHLPSFGRGLSTQAIPSSSIDVIAAPFALLVVAPGTDDVLIEAKPSCSNCLF